MHVIQVDKRVEGGGEDKAKELCRVEPSADPDRDSEAEAEAKAAEEKKRVTKIYRPLSMKLFEVISRVRRVVKTMSMTKWDREMKALVEHDGVPIGEVIVAIEQYGTIIGGEYVPEAWSAGNFREKFRKIQAAIARKGKKMGGRIVRPVMRADNVGKERRRIGG